VAGEGVPREHPDYASCIRSVKGRKSGPRPRLRAYRVATDNKFASDNVERNVAIVSLYTEISVGCYVFPSRIEFVRYALTRICAWWPLYPQRTCSSAREHGRKEFPDSAIRRVKPRNGGRKIRDARRCSQRRWRRRQALLSIKMANYPANKRQSSDTKRERERERERRWATKPGNSVSASPPAEGD